MLFGFLILVVGRSLSLSSKTNGHWGSWPNTWHKINSEQAQKQVNIICKVKRDAHHGIRFFINDDESGLHHDYDVWLEKLAPHEPVSQYRHNVGEDNADAHMKRQIMGREVVVAITDGKAGFWHLGADFLRRI